MLYFIMGRYINEMCLQCEAEQFFALPKAEFLNGLKCKGIASLQWDWYWTGSVPI
jgi:hypothetical protein